MLNTYRSLRHVSDLRLVASSDSLRHVKQDMTCIITQALHDVGATYTAQETNSIESPKYMKS